jgi:hypothetical protein
MVPSLGNVHRKLPPRCAYRESVNPTGPTLLHCSHPHPARARQRVHRATSETQGPFAVRRSTRGHDNTVRPPTAQAPVARSEADEREDYHHTRVELFHGGERGLLACRQDAPDCLGPGFMAVYGTTTEMGTGSGPAGCAAYDPGCVKTHTEKRCRKNNSLAGRRTTPAQYDLTLTGRNCFKMFYACEASRSFHTAWTLSGPRSSRQFGRVTPRRRTTCTDGGRRSRTPGSRARFCARAPIFWILAKSELSHKNP